VAEIPLVDTHFHLHDMKRPELRYSWLEPDSIHGFLGNIDAIKAQHYWIEDYIAEIRFANVPKAVHVQAALGIPDPVNGFRLSPTRPVTRMASSRNVVLPILTLQPCLIVTCTMPTCEASEISAMDATLWTDRGARVSNI